MTQDSVIFLLHFKKKNVSATSMLVFEFLIDYSFSFAPSYPFYLAALSNLNYAHCTYIFTLNSAMHI